MDTIGDLKSIYGYSDLSYVGGGMGNKGLHNTLEPAVFGIPIIIGKNFSRYPEALEMYKLGGILSVSTKNEFRTIWEKLTKNEKICLKMGKVNYDFVRRRVLRQTDSEILEIDEQIEQEIKDGIIPDPNAIDPITGEPLEGEMGMMGDVPTEPDIDGGITDAQLNKDTKSAEI